MGFYTYREYIVRSPTALTIFEKIIDPLLPLLQKEAEAVKNDADGYKLSLLPFMINLLYGIIKSKKSIALLITEIKTMGEQPFTTDLVKASGSMYSEAFGRYDPAIFKRLFFQLIEKINFMEIEELKTLGRFLWEERGQVLQSRILLS